MMRNLLCSLFLAVSFAVAAPARAQAPADTPTVKGSETKESVETQEAWIEPQVTASEIYERVAPSALSGPVGLLHAITGDSGRANTFRIGLHFGGFQQDNFIVAANGNLKGDTNGHFTGTLTIDYTTPWKYLEAYVALFTATNQNTRSDPGRSDPATILSVGDLQLGLKGRLPIREALDLALHVGVKFIDSVSGAGFDGNSTNAVFDAVASWDLRKTRAAVPLRLHANAGFLYDNSLALIPAGQCSASTGNDTCIRSRVVETYAYGIGTSRFRFAVAADLPLAVRSVGLQPLVEYHLDASVGDGDTTVQRALANSVTSDRLSNRVAQFLTFGVRARPAAGLIADVGIDVGLQSPGFQFGAPVPAWNLMAGLQYAYDPRGPRTRSLTKTVTREVRKAPLVSRIRGVVRDATTGKPVPDAIVKYVDTHETPQSSSDDGTFVSYDFGPGTVRMEVSRDDYQPAQLKAIAKEDGETRVEVLLTPKPPAGGTLKAHVADPEGQPVAAAVRLTPANGAPVDAEAQGAGAFNAKLPSGDYKMDVIADGYLAKQRTVNIANNEAQSVEVVLIKKPKESHVALASDEITVNRVIHFGTNDAEIRPDGQQLLDEVADIMVRNPQIKKIRIEGHADSRGDAVKNLALSKARANAVMAYVVKAGIDSSRVEAEGYGAAQPLVPNLTPSYRAKNRRVAFKIVEQAAPAAK